MSELLPTEEQQTEQDAPKSYQKIQMGETGWVEPLDRNFQFVLEQLGQGSVLQNLLDEVKQESTRDLQALETSLTKRLEDRITREEFRQDQQKQDNAIDALRRSLDSGFVGASVTHSFAAAELSHWQGWGTALPMGAVNQLGQLSN